MTSIRRTYAEQLQRAVGWPEPIHAPLPNKRPKIDDDELTDFEWLVRKRCEELKAEGAPDFDERLRMAAEALHQTRLGIDMCDAWLDEHGEPTEERPDPAEWDEEDDDFDDEGMYWRWRTEGLV